MTKKLCGDSPEEINLDASPEDFALLLDLIDYQPIGESYSWPELEKVVILGVKYQFFHLCRLVIGHIHDCPPIGNPWTVFVLASELEVFPLAKAACGNLGRSHLWYADEKGVIARDIAGATGLYAAAPLRAIALNVSAEKRWVWNPFGDTREIRGTDWAGVSKDFDLDK